MLKSQKSAQKQVILQNLPLISYILALVAFGRPRMGCKPSKLPIWALSSVEIFTFSQSPAICVEVPNWSNMSQSQGCAELNEMVQYLHLSKYYKYDEELPKDMQ
jgi:hypothetical protein